MSVSFLFIPKIIFFFHKSIILSPFMGGGRGGMGSGYLQTETVVLFLKGSRDVVVVTALPYHRCDPGFDSRTWRYHVGRVCC